MNAHSVPCCKIPPRWSKQPPGAAVLEKQQTAFYEAINIIFLKIKKRQEKVELNLTLPFFLLQSTPQNNSLSLYFLPVIYPVAVENKKIVTYFIGLSIAQFRLKSKSRDFISRRLWMI